MQRLYEQKRRMLIILLERECNGYKNGQRTTTIRSVFERGDRVRVYQPCTSKGQTRKLWRPWTGPYRVVKKISDVVYRVQLEGGRKRKVVHFNRLKKCEEDKTD